jgi:hypothetical protein
MMMARVLGLSYVLSCAFCLTACQKNDPLDKLRTVSPATAVQQVNLSFCTDPPVDAKFAQKMIIVLDHSTSNKTSFALNPDGSYKFAVPVGGTIPLPVMGPEYGTDPKGIFRYGDINTEGTLLNFLNQELLAQQLPLATRPPAKYFALVNFATDAEPYPSNFQFTSDIVAFNAQVTADSKANQQPEGGPIDDGYTRYVTDYDPATQDTHSGALDTVYRFIYDDIQLAKACDDLPKGSQSPGSWCPVPGATVASTYSIVMITDGAPVVALSLDTTTFDKNGNPVISATRQDNNAIIAEIDVINDLEETWRKYVAGINLNTVYYYTNEAYRDSSAEALLTSVAAEGNGNSYSASITAADRIDYSRFVPLKKQINYNLATVFVTNASSTWWTDGNLYPDGDADGLPDFVDPYPTQYYGNGNGISDLVVFKLGGSPNMGLCGGLTRTGGLGNPYIATDPNGMNDCEKRLLSSAQFPAVKDDPDSNSDKIPDWLEFKNHLLFQDGTSPGDTDPFLEGLTYLERIQSSLPLKKSTTQISKPQPTIYDVTNYYNPTNGQTCYNYGVRDLPRFSATDKIRVDIVMSNTSVLQDTFIYRAVEKSFTPGVETLYFTDWKSNPLLDPTQKWGKWPL